MNAGPQQGQKPGARGRLVSLWGALSVRILTDGNVGSDLRSLLRRHLHLQESSQTAFSKDKTNARGLPWEFQPSPPERGGVWGGEMGSISARAPRRPGPGRPTGRRPLPGRGSGRTWH